MESANKDYMLMNRKVVSLGLWEKQPVEWIVIDEDAESYLLLSRYALERRPFHDYKARITWGNSSLRNWLNDIFLNKAFSVDDRKLILDTEVPFHNNPQFEQKQEASTTDKVFLLSGAEVEKYLSREERILEVTNKTYEKSGVRGYSKKCWWWLRTVGCRQGYESMVYDEGSIMYCGLEVDSLLVMVRPAIRIVKR